MSEVANDVRAKEWQSCHYVLRLALNDILSLGNNQEQAKEVLRLREEFSHRADESQDLLDRSSQNLTELAKRQEFAHALKLSVELIRHKARIQASRVIADELNALLLASSRSTDASNLEARQEPLAAQVQEDTVRPANVVSLSERRAAGSRRGR